MNKKNDTLTNSKSHLGSIFFQQLINKYFNPTLRFIRAVVGSQLPFSSVCHFRFHISYYSF